MSIDIETLIAEEAMFEAPRGSRRRPPAKTRKQKKGQIMSAEQLHNNAVETAQEQMPEQVPVAETPKVPEVQPDVKVQEPLIQVETRVTQETPVVEETPVVQEPDLEEAPAVEESTEEPEPVQEAPRAAKPVTLNLDNEFNKQFVDTWKDIGKSFLDIFIPQNFTKPKAFLGWDVLMDEDRKSMDLEYQVKLFLNHIGSMSEATVLVNTDNFLEFLIQDELIQVFIASDKKSYTDLPTRIMTDWPELQAEITRITGKPYDPKATLKVADFARITGALASMK